MNTQVKAPAPEKEHKVGYVGARISKKQAKIWLANTPKHGLVSRELMKFYMGMRKTAPQQTLMDQIANIQKKKDKK
jgi:hypothetical protein